MIAFKVPELYAVKVARTVLRGRKLPGLRHEVVLYNCFTACYDRLLKPAVPSAVSYQGIGCMVKPLPGEAPGKQYQSLARVAKNGVKNREEFGLWSLNTN